MLWLKQYEADDAHGELFERDAAESERALGEAVHRQAVHLVGKVEEADECGRVAVVLDHQHGVAERDDPGGGGRAPEQPGDSRHSFLRGTWPFAKVPAVGAANGSIDHVLLHSTQRNCSGLST